MDTAPWGAGIPESWPSRLSSARPQLPGGVANPWCFLSNADFQKQALGPGPSLQDPFVLGLAVPAFADPMLPSSSQATDRRPYPGHFC